MNDNKLTYEDIKKALKIVSEYEPIHFSFTKVITKEQIDILYEVSKNDE